MSDSRFVVYTSEVLQGGAVPIWEVDLLSPEGQMLASTRSDVGSGVIKWGCSPEPVTNEGSRMSQRTSALTVQSADPALIPSLGGPLHPDSQNRVVFLAGIERSDGTRVLWEQATMLIDEVVGTLERGVLTWDLALVDTAHPMRSTIEHSVTWPAGTEFSELVARLLRQVMLPGTFLMSLTGFTSSGGFLNPGTDRAQVITDMLESCGHELVTSPTGLVYNREIPSSDDDPNLERWHYGDGVDAIPYETLTKTWTSRTGQAWKIQAGSAQAGRLSPTLIVYDTDPRSEGFWRPDLSHRHIETTTSNYVESVSQAAVAGYGKLRQHSPGPGLVTMTCAPNPAMRENDLVELSSAEISIDGLFRVIGLTLPMVPDELMTVTLRGVFNPGLTYEPPFDREEGCLVSVTDDFTRDDGPLVVPADGEWGYVGGTWQIIGNRAVATSLNKWSFAFWRAPLCSLDQQVEFEIGKSSGWHQMGPVIRSSGEFDGYMALVNGFGEISLQVWVAGKHAASLGYHNAQAPLDGKTITLAATGSGISVKIDSEEVISCTCDRRQGSFVGMVAHGGAGGSWPEVESFAAGPVA